MRKELEKNGFVKTGKCFWRKYWSFRRLMEQWVHPETKRVVYAKMERDNA